MRIEDDVKLDFKDVLIRPKRSTLKSRSEVDLRRPYLFRHSKKEVNGVPIMAANMDTTGTFATAAVLARHGCYTAMNKFASVEQWKDFAAAHPEALPYVAVSCGSSAREREAVKAVLEAVPGLDMICMDVANGYSEAFVEAVRAARAAFPDKTIIAGNVVTGEMVEELILSGADIVKVGIGPGSVCTTRRQTGVGYPQLSAIIECADAAHGLGGHVMADGGCTCPGDVAKAFGAGADFVMLGGMLAGHDESGGELVEREGGRKFKRFYGMSSATAMIKHSGGVAEYRSSEGRTVELPYRGPLEPTILDVLGGLRSSCTYVGAASLKELTKRTTFVRVTAQLNESFRTLETAPPSHGYKSLSGAPAAGGAGSAAAGGAGAASSPAAAAVPADGVLTYTKEAIGIGGVSVGPEGAVPVASPALPAAAGAGDLSPPPVAGSL